MLAKTSKKRSEKNNNLNPHNLMKKLVTLAFGFLIVACQATTEDSLEGKQKALAEKQEELQKLEADIEKLKADIAALDTTEVEERVVPVRVQELANANFNHYVDFTGTVSSRENIMISSEANGRVLSVPAREGQEVSRGQVLVRLDNEAVSRQLEEAEAMFKLAETTYQKRKNLWDQNIGSEIEYLQAENNYKTAKSRLAQVRTQYNNTIVRSPISGTVDQVVVNEGEFISFGAPIVRVVDLDNVEVETELSESYLPAVHRGDTVEVSIPALGVETKAVVNFVSQVINPENRSFKVKVNLPNKEGRIKPNVLANLKIRDYASGAAIVVPSKAISKDLKGDFVYTVSNEGGAVVARKKYIKRGRSSDVTTEILEGLTAGDRVIVSGYDQVNEGTLVEVKSGQA